MKNIYKKSIITLFTFSLALNAFAQIESSNNGYVIKGRVNVAPGYVYGNGYASRVGSIEMSQKANGNNGFSLYGDTHKAKDIPAPMLLINSCPNGISGVYPNCSNSVLKNEEKTADKKILESKNINENELSSTISCPYFTQYLILGSKGQEVKKVQKFLNKELNLNLSVNGIYDTKTKAAVKAFQKKYSKEVLSFWKLNFATGNWYKTTRAQANVISGCNN